LRVSVFRSAIQGSDGQVDAGYLAVFWAMVGWSINNAAILAVALIAVTHENAPSILSSAGLGLGANATGFAAVVGAVGLFRLGDRQKGTTP
jgi:hypothetical protein